MSRNGKVIVAMSGGVDSSVAAWMLREQGYDCVGVFMRVGAHAPEAEDSCALEAGVDGDEPCRDPEKRKARTSPESKRDDAQSTVNENAIPTSEESTRRFKHGCCSAADALDARAVAGKLGIPFYALNFESEFEGIIEYFIDEYARARTPNPCVMCNIRVKFGALLRYADMLDAESVATGHYARIVRDAGGGEARLSRSLNEAKDQSYVLFGIRREELSRCLFPLGEIADKAEVRKIAERMGLRVFDKPDSQEICFVPNNDYTELLRRRRPEILQPGSVRDAAGNVLGTHTGVAGYTIGQRRGLGIATGAPIYVTKLNVLDNSITVGPRDDLLNTGLIAEQVNWLTEPPPAGEPCSARTKIRYMHTAAAGTIKRLDDGTVRVEFDEPQLAVTPGQAAVFYREDGIVLGGGWIREGTQRK